MDRIKHLIHDIHRRSLWQVLGIFLAASWGVLQVVQAVTDSIGLPDWTPGMAFVLLLLGLPVVLATAFVQAEPRAQAESSTADTTDADTPGPVDDGAHDERDQDAPEPSWTDASPPRLPTHLFTWKNAVMGGIGAFALLGFSLVAYFVMWSAGVGPVGSLVAQGVFEEGDAVLLADFTNSTGDASLGDVVTEALRVDLATGSTLTLVEQAAAGEILTLMGRSADDPIVGDVADEVAARGGFSAVIEGEVGSAGSGFILTAAIRDLSGETLATFRRTASNPDEVIAAIDGLSQDIRERAGESLRSIRADEPLEAVTTNSLRALQLFTESNVVRERGDNVRARELLEQALAIDPDFAMAWRALAVVYTDTGGSQAEQRSAATRAYELSDRLTDRERLHAEAYYHRQVTEDLFAEIAAYQTVLDAYPDDQTGLNNLSIAYSSLNRWEEAKALTDRAVNGPGRSRSAYANRPLYASLAGDFAAAEAALDDLARFAPDDELWPVWGAWVLAFSSWDAASGLEAAEQLRNVPGGANWRLAGTRMVAVSSALTGQIAAAREGMQGALTEADRAGDANSVVQTYMDWARMERYLADGDPTPVIALMFERGAMDRVPAENRSNFGWISDLASYGLFDDATRLLDEWDAASGDVQGEVIRVVRRYVEIMELGSEDPAAGARELDGLRTAEQCERCFMWDMGTLYERAGMIEEAIAERQGSIETAEGFWFGARRLLANHSLGRLYERSGDLEKALEHYTIYVQQLVDGDAIPSVVDARERIATLQRGRLTR
ncbi:MAG: hypothetical protein AAF389_02060 [Gemmatimonadota bacterium]